MKIDRIILQEGWYDKKYSEEQCVLNYSTILVGGLNSMSLKCPYESRMMNLSLEWWKLHWNCHIKQYENIVNKTMYKYRK